MCGIAGLILEKLDPRASEWITRMTQAVYHRGPDDGGAVVLALGGRPFVERRLGRPEEAVQWEYLTAQVALGARRLAVLDPSDAARQPMSDDARQTWLVYNGAIYNFRELRRELSTSGSMFRGTGDTEVVLAAYRRWGPSCFEKFAGMWAAAIYDAAARKVLLSRDPLGIKPLYLTRIDEGVAFASEIKSLLELPGVTPQVEPMLLRDFLTRGLVDHTNRTLFEGIWSLSPGCLLEIDLRGSEESSPRLTRFASMAVPILSKRDLPLYGDTGDTKGVGRWRGYVYRNRITDALTYSVASHLVSDVPVGTCLSGGLDSSIIAALIHEAIGDAQICQDPEILATHWSQHTFTASLPGCPLDESRFAKSVIDALGDLTWHCVEPTAGQLRDDIERLMWHQEQPFASPSIYMQWEVMRAAHAEGVRVLLDGQGGDELFCGYEGYIPPLIAHYLRRARLAAGLAEGRGAVRNGHFSRRDLAGHVGAQLLPEAMRDRLRAGKLRTALPWISGDLFGEGPGPDMAAALDLGADGTREDYARFSAVQRFVLRQLTAESLPSLLRFEDRNAMAFSIEARVPFLDRRLVRLAMSIRPEEKIRRGELKAPLRAALGDRVPRDVRDRRDKIGFAAPTAEWLRGDLRPWWTEALTSKSFLERGCFAPKGVLATIRNFDAGDDAAALSIWRMAITEQWARQFLDRPAPAAS